MLHYKKAIAQILVTDATHRETQVGRLRMINDLLVIIKQGPTTVDSLRKGV